MTNILATLSVALATNVAVLWPSHSKFQRHDAFSKFAPHNPTNRVEVVTITGNEVASFTWADGTVGSVTNAHVISVTTNEFHWTPVTN